MSQLFPFSGIQHLLTFFGTETKFGFFLRNVNLQQAVHCTSRFDSLFVDFGQQFITINSMNHRYVWYHVFDFVRLQVSEESADRWFKCKLIFITLDEKSGAEKKTSTQVLVQAADLRDAVKKLDEGMKGTMADYQIGMVSETPLMDVYPYSAEPNDKPEFDPSKA